MIEFPRNALSSLNKLRYLLLDHNQILNLPNYAFQWLVHLERLSLSRNRIHTLNAKTFHSTSTIQLKSLNLGFNKIHIMHTSAFENLPNIEQLFLNNNRLTSLQPHVNHDSFYACLVDYELRHFQFFSNTKFFR